MNCIVLCHGQAAATVARHLPNWNAAFDGLTFISPSDDPLPGSLPIGASCRNGQGAIERLLFAVALASRFPVCAILEYDCLVFGHTYPGDQKYFEPMTVPFGVWANHVEDDGDMLCSETFPNEDPEHIFAAPQYGHAPWITTGETWWKLLQAGSDAQRGFPDRWLANAATRAKVALRGMEGSYSRDRGFDAATARVARLRGCPAIHGCKTEAEYAEIMREGGAL